MLSLNTFTLLLAATASTAVNAVPGRFWKSNSFNANSNSAAPAPPPSTLNMNLLGLANAVQVADNTPSQQQSNKQSSSSFKANGAGATIQTVQLTTTNFYTLSFQNLGDNADPTFNQLLGINNDHTIAGYFGADPKNRGYTIDPPYNQFSFINENFPTSIQTQVTGINDRHDTVGFFQDANNKNFFGFSRIESVYTNISIPATIAPTNEVQLLGINDDRIAVGFFVDGNGNNVGFVIKLDTKEIVSQAPDGYNTNQFDIFFFQFPGSVNTQALGVNKKHELVGVYVSADGNMHGFVAKGLESGNGKIMNIDAPGGVNTTINGLNDKGELVGFFISTTSGTNGFTIGVKIQAS
ncbi:hypothetical protein HDU76_010166 [Blyttiomyces sp. JEL0837]|nr:hypothetical protein HDU76_010166 [Blyttiomyces sp. JEL0837]